MPTEISFLPLRVLHDLQSQRDYLLWERSAMPPLSDCLFSVRDLPRTAYTLLARESSIGIESNPVRLLNCVASSVCFLQDVRPGRLSQWGHLYEEK